MTDLLTHANDDYHVKSHEYICPRPGCGSPNTFGPNDENEVICFDCGYVFDMDERPGGEEA